MRKNRLRDQAFAIIDAVGGQAVIEEPGGRIFILNVEHPGVLKDGKGVHLGMLLQPGLAPLRVLQTVGRYPYSQVVHYLDLAHREQQALAMLMIILDRDAEAEARELAISALEELLADHNVSRRIKDLLTIPLPPEADLAHCPKEGRVGKLLREVINKPRG